MAKQNNLQLYRGQGIPPANSMLEGEIAMDTDRKVLWINNGQAIKPVGIIEGGTTPSADYAGTLWIDNNASPTGIPADFLVANNLTTQAPGSYVLDAYQGKILKDALDAQGAVISDQADEISELSDQINNLDESVSDLSESVSDLSTWDNTESDGFLYYRLGKLVIVVGRKNVTATSLNQWIQVTTIPEGYRPITYLDVLGLNNNHGEPLCMRLNTGGVINAWFTTLSGATAGASIPVRLVCTYVIA